MEQRFEHLERDLNARISLAENKTRDHISDNNQALTAVRGELAAMKDAVLEQASSNAADSLAQMHVLGLVARAVKVDPKKLKLAFAKVKVTL